MLFTINDNLQDPSNDFFIIFIITKVKENEHFTFNSFINQEE